MKYLIMSVLLMSSLFTFAEDAKLSDKDMLGKLELDEGRTKILKGTYKLNLTDKPKCLEMTIEGQTKYAIFELTGKDELKMDRPQAVKPKDFGPKTIAPVGVTH